MTFDFQRFNNTYGDISVATACQGKQREHAEIDRQLAEYLARGNQIQTIPSGTSGATNGVYGPLAKHATKVQRQKAAKLAAKLYDDQPDEQQE